MLNDSTSEVYTYVLFGVVNVDVYCVRPCGTIISLDVFRVICFEIKVKDVEGRYNFYKLEKELF